MAKDADGISLGGRLNFDKTGGVMAKRVTLTVRWIKWATGSEGRPAEPLWAYSALGLMMLSFASLGVHLFAALSGTIRGVALIVMIAAAVGCDLILFFRRQYFWFWYWTICVLAGVSIFEIASYFFGSKI